MADQQSGQAQIELVAAVPFLVLSVLVIIQLFGVLYAQSMADGAAHAGALAMADGRQVEGSVRSSLPGWSRERITVDADGGRVRVEVSPPAVLPWIGDRLEVSASAYAKSGS